MHLPGKASTTQLNGSCQSDCPVGKLYSEEEVFAMGGRNTHLAAWLITENRRVNWITLR